MRCPWRGMMRFRHPGDAPDNVPDSTKSPWMFPAMFRIQFPIGVRDSLGRPGSRPDPMGTPTTVAGAVPQSVVASLDVVTSSWLLARPLI